MFLRRMVRVVGCAGFVAIAFAGSRPARAEVVQASAGEVGSQPPGSPIGAPAVQPGCVKDTECKGDRVCEGGVCVAPAPSGRGPVQVGPAGPARSVGLEPQDLGQQFSEYQLEELKRRRDEISIGVPVGIMALGAAMGIAGGALALSSPPDGGRTTFLITAAGGAAVLVVGLVTLGFRTSQRQELDKKIAKLSGQMALSVPVGPLFVSLGPGQMAVRF